MYAVNYFSISTSNLLIFSQPFLWPHLSFFFSSTSFHFTPNTALDDVITASKSQRQQPYPIPMLFKQATGLDTVAYSFPFNTFFFSFLFFPFLPLLLQGQILLLSSHCFLLSLPCSSCPDRPPNVVIIQAQPWIHLFLSLLFHFLSQSLSLTFF